MVQESQRNKAEIKELRQELRELTVAVQRLVYEIHGENDAHEREKLALRVENELLKLERRLPPATTQTRKKDKK